MVRNIKFVTSNFYHVYNRGVRKSEIFLKNQDYKRWEKLLYWCNNYNYSYSRYLSRLFQIKRKGGSVEQLNKLVRMYKLDTPLVEIHAFVEMPNHFHLLLRQISDGGIAKFMQKLATAYAMYFNLTLDFKGAVFEGSYCVVEMLSDALERPKRPFLVIIGGAKTPEKIAVIERILDIADTVALGGAIANTFLAAWGFGMGKSYVDYEMVEMARVIFWKTTRKHSALILPLDVITSNKDKNVKPKVVDYNNVSHNTAIYDIGPKTRQHYRDLIFEAKTVIWNGPMGLYEDPRFTEGTDSILENISQSKSFSIVGGGDTLTSIKSQKYLKIRLILMKNFKKIHKAKLTKITT